MEIEISRIPLEGLTLEDGLTAQELGLGDEILKFNGPIRVRAEVTKITNALTVDISLKAMASACCSRCLKEVEVDFSKGLQLNYLLEKTDKKISLDEDIRQELILDYPMKTLCKSDCKGLCPVCGIDLNEGICNCKK
ncbi:MAG: DUF177 domain-containing protein [Candidatus Omnitrophota bacterium]